MPTKLYLLPNLLDDAANPAYFFPPRVQEVVSSIQGLIAESEKAARRYLLRFISKESMQKLSIQLLNEHTKEIENLIKPLERGEAWGLISDAGLSCLADPGSELVWLARQKKIPIEAVVGPSSIFLALQLSGFDGQRFAFHGYLPREEKLLEKTLKKLEGATKTQIWIEAPYRSKKMLETAKRVLHPKTKLCVAVNLSSPLERVVSQTIQDWKKIDFSLGKEPAIFLICCPVLFE